MNTSIKHTLADAQYAFGSDPDREFDRLIRQARLIDPITEELLREAGVCRGMHVVDLGSGAGDTALLLAKLVSPTGSVLGIDNSAERVAGARARAADTGLNNVTFLHADAGDLATILADGRASTDAVVGRLILGHVDDASAVLRACATGLGPGSLVWFLEADSHYEPAFPCPPLWQSAVDWWRSGLRAAGGELRMGPTLYSTFRAAGLPAPTLRCRTLMSGPQDAPVWWLVDLVRAVLPVLERAGIAAADEIGLDTLEERLRAELLECEGVMLTPPITTAWTRLAV